MRQLPHLLRLSPVAFLVAVALPAGAAAPATVVSEVAPFHYTAPVSAPRTVRLDSFNGDITATAATDGKLDVRAEASSGDTSPIRIITHEENGGVAICVLFVEESPDTCRLSGANHNGSNTHRNPPSIRLVARVPAGVSLIAATLNGSVHARGIPGEVRATTANGHVEVSAVSIAAATTMSGNVEASFGQPPSKGVELSTKNGNVTVKLPANTDADVSASTVNGKITTSFPMPLESTPGGYGPQSGHGKIGKGGPKLQIETINGNIDVKAGGAS